MKVDKKAKPQDASMTTASNLATDKEMRQRQLNRERQRRYRQRALKDAGPDGLLLTRLQVMISPHADRCLTRICEITRMTKREAVEKALIELERQVTDG